MPGFSRMEQARLARIVLAHRGKLRKMQDAGLEGADWKLVFALRIAVAHPAQPHRRAGCRSCASPPTPAASPSTCRSRGSTRIALSAAALESETDHWKSVGMKLAVSGLSDKKVSVLKQVR